MLLLLLLLLLNVVLILMLAVLLQLLVAGHVLELRVGKSSRAARLKGATQEQLGRKKGRKLHVESSAGRGHIGGIVVVLLLLMLVLVLLAHGLSVDRRDVPAAWMPVGESSDLGVRSECTMREARIAVGRLRCVTVAGTLPSLGTRQVLHPEKMRRDKTVPGDVR